MASKRSPKHPSKCSLKHPSKSFSTPSKRPCPLCHEQLHPKSYLKHIRRKHPPLTTPSLTITNVLFITIPAQKNIKSDDANTSRVHFPATNPNCERNIDKLGGTKHLNELKKSLGQELVAVSQGTCYIDQLLATAILAANKDETKWQLQHQKWASAIPLIRSGTLFDNLQDTEGNGQTVLFVSSTSAHWPEMSQSDFLDAIHPIVAGYSHIRVYPSISEQRFEMLKIADIRTLDAIATAVNCPHEFSFRPTTCYGYGKCALSQLRPGDHHVLKRSESCASSHVLVKKSADRGELRCTLSGTSLNDNGTRQNSSSPLWFHQEFVPDLDAFEFRVFIKNNTTGGEVFHIIWTASAPLARGVPGARNITKARKASEDDFSWAVPDGASQTTNIQRAKMQELHEFALYVYGALRRWPDAKLYFETLEVGVRLDIGVFNGHFFVNEITRWLETDWFSESTVEAPYMRLCAEFAEPLARFLG